MIDESSHLQHEHLPVLLVLTSTYPRWRGDPEPAFIHELGKRLTGRFRVLLLGPHASGALREETLDGVEVYRYRYAPERWETLVNDGGIVTNLRRSKWKLLLVPGFVLAQTWWAMKLIRRERVDAIHAHWLVPQGLIAAMLQSLPGRKIKYVVTSHGADLFALRGRLMEALKRFVLRRAAGATVVSSAMRENLLTIGADVSRVSVLSMGVDVSDRFKPDAAAPRSDHEILFVGRLVEKKGLRFLLQALPGIVRQCPDAYLSIAGFGPEEDALRRQARSLGLDDKVRFLGAMPQEELPALYRRAAVFVAPFIRAESGDQEGLPVALMEAIACGCPILAGDVTGLHDMLDEHAASVVLDPRDVRGLEARVLSVLAEPRAPRERAMRMSAFVRERFDWDRIAGGYAAVLESALRAQPG